MVEKNTVSTPVVTPFDMAIIGENPFANVVKIVSKGRKEYFCKVCSLPILKGTPHFTYRDGRVHETCITPLYFINTEYKQFAGSQQSNLMLHITNCPLGNNTWPWVWCRRCNYHFQGRCKRRSE